MSGGIIFTPGAAKKVVRGAQEGLKGGNQSGRTAPGLRGRGDHMPVTDVVPTVDTAGLSWIDYTKGVLMYNYPKEVVTGEGEEQTTTVVPTRDYIGTFRGDLEAELPTSSLANPRNGSEYFIEVSEEEE